jgi:hypothetical protein
MRFLAGMVVLTLIMVFPSTILLATTTVVVLSYKNVPSPVLHAVDRLSAYTGIPLGQAKSNFLSLKIEINATKNPRIEPQGYTIRSAHRVITIGGNDNEGVANGVYTLLRTLMIEHRKDPFSREWNMEEKPAFTLRSMQIAPYRYGASYGFAALSPDRWSFEQWKEYVDFMRLCNMTTLAMGSTRMYDPEYPDSRREQWRYEVWKQVMDYCHQIGMKFDWFMMPNLVPEQAFWDHPEKRYVNEHGAWYGNGLDWNKGKEEIIKTQKYTMGYFRDLDSLIMMYSDGGSFFFDSREGSSDPTAGFSDVTNAYLKLLHDVGNHAKFVNMNWGLQLWADLTIPKSVYNKYPKYRTLQNDTIPLLPKDAGWEDASVLTWIQNFGIYVRAAGNPPVSESLLAAKEHGFKPVIDLFWYMNPEVSINMFPHPYIRRAIQEARYAHDELAVDGAKGYRLAPPMRFVDDYVFFRVTSDPSLTQEQLVSEVAGLLTENSENEVTVKEAINTLEQFWSTHKLEDIEKVDRLFREVLLKEHSKNLEYVSNGVTFWTYIMRLSQPGVTAEQKIKLKQELYETIKPMYILQGLTADIVWTPEAVRFFNARVDMMLQDYAFYLATPEVVDRSIYPQATSQAVQFQWSKGGAETH